MLAEIFGHKWHLRWRFRGTEVNGGAIHYILGVTVGFRMCKLPHEWPRPTSNIFVIPDSSPKLCMVKKTRGLLLLFGHTVSICASTVTHLTGCDGGNSPHRSHGQPMGAPQALFESLTGLWTTCSRHRGFLRVQAPARWPSCDSVQNPK
jgi:hypothetical protein